MGLTNCSWRCLLNIGLFALISFVFTVATAAMGPLGDYHPLEARSPTLRWRSHRSLNVFVRSGSLQHSQLRRMSFRSSDVRGDRSLARLYCGRPPLATCLLSKVQALSCRGICRIGSTTSHDDGDLARLGPATYLAESTARQSSLHCAQSRTLRPCIAEGQQARIPAGFGLTLWGALLRSITPLPSDPAPSIRFSLLSSLLFLTQATFPTPLARSRPHPSRVCTLAHMRCLGHTTILFGPLSDLSTSSSSPPTPSRCHDTCATYILV